jgi:predicted AAA+ superfamily ATPase
MTEDILSLESLALKNAGLALDSLTVYRRLLDDDQVIAHLEALIDCCRQSRVELSAFLNHYGDFFAALADSAADSLEDYLIEAILFHDNAFTRSLECGRRLPSPLAPAAAHDLDCLQQLAGLAPAVFKTQAAKHCRSSESELALVKRLPEWQQQHGKNRERPTCRHEELRNSIMASSRWSDRLDDLIAFHHQYGAGIFARYRAFYWDHTEGCLRGIADPDPVTLSDLIGYEAERADVLENTLQFLDGWSANNVLLYGDRGTGKSSTVKALLNEHHRRGLRLVEVTKTQLFDFPDIIRSLKERGQKFIVFVDDLSFEDSESSYTALKAVLEGGLEHRPGNVLIYATSNRRHLIRERVSDRAGLQSGHVEDEARARDTVQEKLSLADRFGITVIFSTPDQGRYLEIAEGIAARRELPIDREQLQRAALQWECWHNGRSPRTARQFVDWLEGKINEAGNGSKTPSFRT